MDGFVCDMKIEGLGTVKSGKKATFKAVLGQCDRPTEYVEMHVPLAGIRERFQKVSDREFSMEMIVPYGGTGLCLDVRFYAVDSDGEKSAAHEEKVVVG